MITMKKGFPDLKALAVSRALDPPLAVKFCVSSGTLAFNQIVSTVTPICLL